MERGGFGEEVAVSSKTVKFSLPLGELVVRVPSIRAVVTAEPSVGDHVVVELRTPRGELISIAAYRDIQALLGREAPVVWAAGAGGEFVRVTGFARRPSDDAWWDGVLERVLAGDAIGGDE